MMKPHTCPVCNGVGVLNEPIQSSPEATTVCHPCKGSGIVWELEFSTFPEPTVSPWTPVVAPNVTHPVIDWGATDGNATVIVDGTEKPPEGIVWCSTRREREKPAFKLDHVEKMVREKPLLGDQNPYLLYDQMCSAGEFNWECANPGAWD